MSLYVALAMYCLINKEALMRENKNVKNLPEMSPEIKASLKQAVAKRFNMDVDDIEDVYYNRLTLFDKTVELEIVIELRKDRE